MTTRLVYNNILSIKKSLLKKYKNSNNKDYINNLYFPLGHQNTSFLR